MKKQIVNEIEKLVKEINVRHKANGRNGYKFSTTKFGRGKYTVYIEYTEIFYSTELKGIMEICTKNDLLASLGATTLKDGSVYSYIRIL